MSRNNLALDLDNRQAATPSERSDESKRGGKAWRWCARPDLSTLCFYEPRRGRIGEPPRAIGVHR
jgi:hypothetical protein